MDNKRLFIYPECYVDTNLVNFLIDGKSNHQHSCNKVLDCLKKNNGFAVGMIDDDKRKTHPYFGEFEKVCSNGHLVLYKYKGITIQYLITIKPAIDKFLLDLAGDCNVDLSKFGLSSDLEEFKKRTKRESSSTDTAFRLLFKAVEEHSEMKALKASFDYLINKKYKATTDEIINAFK